MDTPETLRLIRNYWYLCRITAKKRYPFLSESELEDLEAVRLQGLLKAARSWRPDGGMSFTSFAILCIQRTMQKDRITEERRRKRETDGMMPLYLSEPVTEGGASIEDFLPDLHGSAEGQIVGKEDLARRFARVWNWVEELPKRQRQAIELFYMQDRTLQEVAQEMGLNDNAGRQAVFRAVNNLRRRFH